MTLLAISSIKGIPQRTLRRWAKQKKIKARLIKGEWFLDYDHLQRAWNELDDDEETE